MVLQESGEMYLESILVLIRQGKAVRSIDIVDYMGYSKPSVSRAVGLLKAGQYICLLYTSDAADERCRGRLPHGARHQ